MFISADGVLVGILGPFILRPLPNKLPGHTKGCRGDSDITSGVRSQGEVLPAIDLVTSNC